MAKYSDRYSPKSFETSETDPLGKIFINDTGNITDLTKINIVGTSVDTVRQLYFGLPSMECIDHLEHLCLTKSNITNEILHGVWHLSHMGKAARYRFKIQNNDLGFVILFGSYFSRLDQEAQHLKIELSPKYIAANSPSDIQNEMNAISQYFLTTSKPKGCAVHLACDVQGWEVPQDFINRFTTYSRTIKQFDGLSEIDLGDFSNSAVKYGGKSAITNYTIGRPAALQMCIYDKSQEIKISDKVDFCHNEWRIYSLGTFIPLDPVKRIEARFHHNVIREVGNGISEELESFEQVAEHLTDIWRYALTRNRLDESLTTIDPFWQLIQEDCEFYAPTTGLYVKRAKKNDVSAIGRNFTAILGNLISVMARNREHTAKTVMYQLKKLAIFEDMLRYYHTRDINEADLYELVDKSLSLRRLTGKAA